MARSGSQYLIVDLPELEITYIGFRWMLEGQELERAIGEVYTEICNRDDWALIWDFQSVGRLAISPGDVNRYVEMVQDRVEENDCYPRRVILIAQDDVINALARLYQHLSSEYTHPVAISLTLSEACRYIPIENCHEIIKEQVYSHLENG